MTRRLGAVGTLIWDRIHHPSRAATEQWGGAAYSLAALSAACPPGWTIEPIMKVGADLWDRALPMIEALENVEAGPALERVPEPNNRVELRYRDRAHRLETLTGGVPAWSPDRLRGVIPRFSALYINFISGMEMDLAGARQVRREFGGFVYGDLHSLFLGPPGDGPRVPRRLPEWEAWLGCFDAVQMNEVELSLLGIEPAGIEELLELGPSLVVVTRGEAGVAYAWRPVDAASATAETGSVPPPDGALDGDPTGCGDVWGATLCASILSGVPLVEGLERAHRAAAAKIRSPRVDGLSVALASSNPPYGVLP